MRGEIRIPGTRNSPTDLKLPGLTRLSRKATPRPWIRNGAECVTAMEAYARRVLTELGSQVLSVTSRVDRPKSESEWEAFTVARHQFGPSEEPEFLLLAVNECEALGPNDDRQAVPEGLACGFVERYLTADEARFLAGALDPNLEDA